MDVTKLPESFVAGIKKITGKEFDAFLESMEQPAPVSVRVNKQKHISDFDSNTPVPWATGAFYLPERIRFTLDPLFHAGCYYVQDASSMYLEQVIKAVASDNTPLRVLDLCAAPGGKSTHLLSILPEGSLLVSNEVIPNRNGILRYNMEKWGYDNVVVTQNDPADLGKLEGFFDIIVIDAPCSGEGLFRKDQAAVDEWSESNVTNCTHRQSQILDAIYPALKKNGVLIYSTCTYEKSENEDQVTGMIKKYSMLPIKIDAQEHGLVCSEFGCRFYPHRIQGEGFFIAALIKTEETNPISFRSKNKLQIADQNLLQLYFNTPEHYKLIRKDDELYAFPLVHLQDITMLLDTLFVRKAGIHLGTMKGKDVVPSHELALNVDLSSSIQRFELSLDIALKYLKSESIPPAGMSNGWTVVTYRDFVLGWIKVMGNRVNNYFPKNQRILMQV